VTPTFENVPDHWKQPLGPYRQAPSEYGGRWWMTNPFTGEQPWTRSAPSAVTDSVPAGFEDIFGKRPQSQDFHSASNPSLAFRMAITIWEQELTYFKKAGFPEWAPSSHWQDATAAFRFWGLGEPTHYEGRYGWMTRFTGAQIRDFECTTWTALHAAHLVVAQYQLRLLDEGIVPGIKHPFVPPSAWPQHSE